MTKEAKGIVLGRFQPLHEGHEHLIQNALDNFETVLILIGSANQVRSSKNPYTYQERLDMISRRFYDEFIKGKILIAPLNDYRYDDKQWELDFLETVRYYGFHSAKICAHLKDDNQYLKKISSGLHVFTSDIDIDATRVRNKLYECRALPVEVMDDINFYKKEHEMFSSYPFPETLQFNCADAVVLHEGNILLVQRKNAPGRNTWALPGGYKNANETFKDAAIRELAEETGINVKEYTNYNDIIVEQKTYDTPNRSFGITRVTQAFLFNLPDKTVPSFHAGDDASKAMWVPLEKIAANFPLYDDHKDIIFDMVERYTKIRQLPAYKCVY